MELGSASRKSSWLVLAVSLLICAGFWRWAETVLVPANTVAARTQGIPIGSNSDLYPRWLGARELLLHHRDPYSAEVTRDIQKGFYGRPLDPQNPSDPRDQVAFAYPLYVIFLLAPTVTLPFAVVREATQWLLLLGIAASVPLWMRAAGFRARWMLVVSGMLLTMGSYPAVLEFHMQNLAALVALLLALASAALVRNWLLLSGCLLALSTIKPQLSWLFVLCFLLWAAGRWRDRKRLVWGFVGMLLGLMLGAELLSPHWIGEFITTVRNYQAYTANPSFLQAFFPAILARVVGAILVGMLLFFCWRWKAVEAGSRPFAWSLAWVATVTLILVPVSAYNQCLLIPALVLLLAESAHTLKAGRVPRALFKGVIACQGWQWSTALILAVCSLFMPAEQLWTVARAPAYTLLALVPITFLTLLASTFALQIVAE